VPPNYRTECKFSMLTGSKPDVGYNAAV